MTIQKIEWNNFSGGLSEYSYKGNENQFTDAKNISLNPFFVECGFEVVSPTAEIPDNVQNLFDTKANLAVQTSSGVYVFVGNTWIQTAISHADFFIHINNGEHKFHNNVNYEGKWYVFTSHGITRYSWFPFEMEQTVAFTEGDNTRVLAICEVWGNILVARGNRIFEYSPKTHSINRVVMDNIPYSEQIKDMFFYADELVIVTQNKQNTNIYRCVYDDGAFREQYFHTVFGVKYISGVQENGIIWWISDKALHMTQMNQSVVYHKRRFLSEDNIFYHHDTVMIKKSDEILSLRKLFTGVSPVLIPEYSGVWKANEQGALIGKKVYTFGEVYKGGKIMSNTLLDFPGKKWVKGAKISFSFQKANYPAQPIAEPKIEVFLMPNGETSEITIASVNYETYKNEQIVMVTENEIAKAFEQAGKDHCVYSVKIGARLFSGGKTYTNAKAGGYSHTPTLKGITVFYEETNNEDPR